MVFTSTHHFPLYPLLHWHIALSCGIFLGSQYKAMVFRNIAFSDIFPFTLTFLERSENSYQKKNLKPQWKITTKTKTLWRLLTTSLFSFLPNAVQLYNLHYYCLLKGPYALRHFLSETHLFGLVYTVITARVCLRIVLNENKYYTFYLNNVFSWLIRSI